MSRLFTTPAAAGAPPPENSTETVDVSHAEFCRGLPAGHFRLIVNPERARKFVRHRLMVVAVTLPIAAIGLALAVMGSVWIGLALIVAGVLINRVISAQAPKILLHLVQQSERAYREAIDYEILEVRRAL